MRKRASCRRDAWAAAREDLDRGEGPPQASSAKVDPPKDSERSKNVYERKLFDKRVGKLTGEKTEKGSQEFTSWLFDVRKVTAEDPPFHDFLDWIMDMEGEVTKDKVTKKMNTERPHPGEPLHSRSPQRVL